MASSSLPSYLLGVQTPAQAVHPDKDFQALDQEYNSLDSDEKKIQFLIDNVPGCGSLGAPALNHKQLAERRVLNRAIQVVKPGTPGSNHRTSYQPPSYYDKIWQMCINNSSLLDTNKWLKASNYQASSPSWVHLFVVNQYTRDGKQCTLMHGMLGHFPEPHDGDQRVLEVVFNPYAVEDLDRAVIDPCFKEALRNEERYRDPMGQAEQLMVGPKLNPMLANADLMWTGKLDENKYLPNYWAPATARGRSPRDMHVQGALSFNLAKSGTTNLGRVLRFIGGSYDAGYPMSNAHMDDGSCFKVAARIIAEAKYDNDWAFTNQQGLLPNLLSEMAQKADLCRWSSEKGKTLEDFAGNNDCLPVVTATEFMQQLMPIFDHASLKEPFGGEPAFNTTYCCSSTPIHPDEYARGLYSEGARLHFELLKQKARDLGIDVEMVLSGVSV